ncbi:MAG: MerR family transcriptional regulator [Verrucomicrobiales bacterium]|nr:MerR family transcriptional regulator [Verrucomicrobiales bacterium]
MKSVAQRTGLSPHVIRVWERRYGAVEPGRTTTNRRLYSDAEVGRLALLGAATRAGHSIGTIARLPDDQLRALAGSGSVFARREPDGNGHGSALLPEDGLLAAALSGIRNLDGRTLEATLQRAGVELGAQGSLLRVVAPLVQRLGDLWHNGDLTAAQEHFATGVLRTHLAHLARPYALAEHAPGLLVATPAGQLHEMGALLAAAAAAGHGWRVTYLGTSLPAVEIAGGAVRSRARAVALSLVYPEDDPELGGQLEELRRLLPAGLPVLVGGRAAAAYGEALARADAQIVKDLVDFCRQLDEIRAPRSRGMKALQGATPTTPSAVGSA